MVTHEELMKYLDSTEFKINNEKEYFASLSSVIERLLSRYNVTLKENN